MIKGDKYYVYSDENYDKYYRICYKAAANFINKSNVFSKLKPEEIIKVFANFEFKENSVRVISSWSCYYLNFKLYEELLEVNKEMLLALIKAINDKKIEPVESFCFIDGNGDLGARSDIDDNEMIRLYRILLEYNHFSLDNLNIKNISNEIMSPMTKRAI